MTSLVPNVPSAESAPDPASKTAFTFDYVLAMQSYRYHYEMIYTIMWVCGQTNRRLVWALPMDDNAEIITFYCNLAASLNCPLRCISYLNVQREQLLRASLIVLPSANDPPCFDQINVPCLRAKSLLLDHTPSPPFPGRQVRREKYILDQVPCAPLVSVQQRWNANATKPISVCVIGVMPGNIKRLSEWCHRVKAGTPNVSFVFVARADVYHELTSSLGATTHVNASEKELFQLAFNCTHLFIPTHKRASGSNAMALSLLLAPIIETSQYWYSKWSRLDIGCTFLDSKPDPIRLMLPTKDQLNNYHAMRLEHCDFWLKFYEPMPVMAIAPSVVAIPNIIHSVWLAKDVLNSAVPRNCNKYLSQRNNLADFRHVFWDNNAADKAMEEYGLDATFILKLRQCRHFISLCDIVRFIIVYLHGGLYVDLDFALMAPQKILTAHPELVLFREIPEHSGDKQVCNGLFAAVPRHPVIKAWIDHMLQLELWLPDTDVMATTGPRGLCSFLTKHFPQVELLKGAHVMPLDNQGKFSSDLPPDVWAYTLWTEGSGWGNVISDELSAAEEETNDVGTLGTNVAETSDAYETAMIVVSVVAGLLLIWALAMTVLFVKQR